jgi:hypothetical protein
MSFARTKPASSTSAINNNFYLMQALHEERVSLQSMLQLLSKEELKQAENRIREIDEKIASLHVVPVKLKEADEKPVNAVQIVKPLYIFTEDQIKEIDAHRDHIDEALKPLIDAAILDEISYELMTAPVYIKKDGHTYNHKTLVDMLEGVEKRACPLNDNIEFSQHDIIPCNTLLNAMQILLDVIHKKDVAPKKSDKKFSFNIELTDKQRKRIKPEEIAAIEQYYQMKLKPHQQALFDSICRDPKTGKIMDDPVFLPDGYVYDRATALFFLEECEGMRNGIKFTEADITDCHFVVGILGILQRMAEKLMMKQAQPAASAERQSSAAQLSAPSSPSLMTKIEGLLKEIHEDKYQNSNIDMEEVLKAALRALDRNDLDVLQAAKKEHPAYNQSQTKFAGKLDSSSSWFGRMYHSAAKAAGTTTGIGDRVDAIVKEAKQHLIATKGLRRYV